MSPFLSRVDLAGSLEQFLVRVADAYRLGSIKSHAILPDGYQELNVLILTTIGRFVVKIFSKEKALRRVQDNVWGFLTFRKNGVPMPALRETFDGEYIFSTEGRRRTLHCIIMDYVEGQYLYPRDARKEDVRALARFMAIIHTHTKRIHRYYDTMGLVNVLSQYKKFERYLPADLDMLIQPVMRDFSAIRLNVFHHSIIHGTFEPENVLKNNNGQLHLLDLGCMDYHASIVDIATFLANFTIDLSLDKKRNTTNIFLQTYQITRPLSSTEFTALPVLVRSQYAVYIIRTNYYRVKLKDTTEQTSRLFSMGRRGLQQWVNLNAL